MRILHQSPKKPWVQVGVPTQAWDEFWKVRPTRSLTVSEEETTKRIARDKLVTPNKPVTSSCLLPKRIAFRFVAILPRFYARKERQQGTTQELLQRTSTQFHLLKAPPPISVLAIQEVRSKTSTAERKITQDTSDPDTCRRQVVRSER